MTAAFVRDHSPPIEPAPGLQLLPTLLQLGVVLLSLTIHFSRHINQPILAAIALLPVTAVPLVVGEVQAKGILLADPQLFMRHVVVPTNKVDGIAEIITVRAVVAGAALIPIPGGLLGL